MEKEILYLVGKISDLEKRVASQENHPHLKDSEGLQHLLKFRKEEIVLLKNILNKVSGS